jgi:hypothetical protein
MAELLRWLASKTDEHLSDEKILAAIDGDSPVPLSAEAARHLDSCWQCLARKQQLKEAIVRVVDYQRELLAPFLPPPPRGEERFIARLDSQLQDSRREWWPRFLLELRPLGFPHMNPVFASIFVVLLAFGALLIIWKRTGPVQSASEFLERAEVWDKSPGNHEAGVVYQRIQIRTRRQTMERTIYRDAQRRRTPKGSQPSAQEEQLKGTLVAAGVPWEEPLSASAFQSWHDRQEIKRDKVERTGDDLLTLTTSVQGGAVANESLTVRIADFHPVARNIQFRDAETVELAELDYAVLGWNAVNDSIFEPVASWPAAAPPLIAVPSLPTREELDEAELQARLALSRLNAESEQLEFSRSYKSVVVKGIVETDARKNSLLAQLRPLPHITPSIFSLEELNARRVSERSSMAGIQEYSDVARSSPLETFLRQQEKPPSDVNSISQQVLDAAVTVQQESSALTELSRRFPPGAHLSDQARVALNELLDRQTARLANGLDTEEQVVHSIFAGQGSPPGSLGAPHGDESQTLTAAAARNRALCSELIGGAQSSSRPAAAIAADILRSIEEVRQRAEDSRIALTKTAPQVSPAERP